MQKSADAFRTISEVADDLSLPQHVLRFWETRFPQIRPLKRAGGRRYYRPADVVLLRAIRQLLYDDGYTIKGVQRLLKEQGAKGLGAGVRTTETADETDDALAYSELSIEDASHIRDGAAAEDRPYGEEGSVSIRPPRDLPDAQLGYGPAAPRIDVAHRNLIERALSTVEECQRILDALLRPSR